VRGTTETDSTPQSIPEIGITAGVIETHHLIGIQHEVNRAKENHLAKVNDTEIEKDQKHRHQETHRAGVTGHRKFQENQL